MKSDRLKQGDRVAAQVNATDQSESVPTAPLSKTRRRLFIAIAMLMAVCVPVCVEGVLRLCGMGGHPPVIEVMGEFQGRQLATTWIPGAASYFDTAKSTPGGIGQYTFAVPKPAKTFRVVLAGASALKGYPQPMGLANSAFLEAMLGDVWNDRTVEVINLGTPAVATFPVLDMLTQALAYEPDLVIVYAGHNEFFGAYGVASAQFTGNSPASIRFARWRSGLGLVELAARLTASPKASSNKALMEAMVGQANVAPDSPLREAAARNVGVHIGEMIDRCKAIDVPVMVCTLPSNEKDLAPVGVMDTSQFDVADRTRLNRLIESGAGKISSEPSAAATDLREALKICPQHARAHFFLGRALLASGDVAASATHFQQAVDNDPMPWRAPSATNDAIVSAAKAHGAPLCDARSAFRAASTDGIIGLELMDDHVHFSLRGQALLARTIVEALTDFDGSCAVAKEAFAELPDWTIYADRLGANEYERYAVAHGLRKVFEVPFMRISNAHLYNHWDGVCAQLKKQWPAAVRQAAQEWEDPKQHSIVRRPLSAFVARILIREKKFAQAKPLMEFSARCVPLYSTWNIEYVYSTLLCKENLRGRLDDADRQLADDTIERVDFMSQHLPNTALIQRYAGRLHQLCGRWKESIPPLEEARESLYEIEKVACDAALIEAYLQTGQPERARALANFGVANAGEFAEHYRSFLKAIPPG